MRGTIVIAPTLEWPVPFPYGRRSFVRPPAPTTAPRVMRVCFVSLRYPFSLLGLRLFLALQALQLMRAIVSVWLIFIRKGQNCFQKINNV